MNNKVLIIGPNFYEYNNSVARAFQKLGWETKVIDFYESYPSGLKNKIIYGGFSKIGIEYFKKKYNKKINHYILNVYREMSPDVVFIIKGHKLFTKTLEKMKDSKLILWMMDSIYRVHETYNNIKLFDYIFMFDKIDVEKLKKEGFKAYFMPLAVDDKIYYPINNKKDIDILFVGGMYPKRLEILKGVISAFPDLNIQIYGKFTKYSEPKTFLNYYFKRCYINFKNINIPPNKVNELYSRTKIALNIHHKQSKYGCNPRFFEILGSRTFQLVDFNEYIDDILKNGTHFVFYKDVNNLISLIEYYLKDEEKRKKIACCGYEEVKNKHTFTNRIKEILALISL